MHLSGVMPPSAQGSGSDTRQWPLMLDDSGGHTPLLMQMRLVLPMSKVINTAFKVDALL